MNEFDNWILATPHPISGKALIVYGAADNKASWTRLYQACCTYLSMVLDMPTDWAMESVEIHNNMIQAARAQNSPAARRMAEGRCYDLTRRGLVEYARDELNFSFCAYDPATFDDSFVIQDCRPEEELDAKAILTNKRMDEDGLIYLVDCRCSGCGESSTVAYGGWTGLYCDNCNRRMERTPYRRA
jgi:hypothetical protein